MTRDLLRDFMVVEQVLKISRQWSGRCGSWSLYEKINYKKDKI
jgi:hypothetical protein